MISLILVITKIIILCKVILKLIHKLIYKNLTIYRLSELFFIDFI